MKSFLKKRWHHLPIGIISAVLVACLLAGSAFAWYQVTTGTADVTVDEAISYTVTAGGDGSFDTDTSVWTVSIYPGEMKVLYMTVFNDSSVALDVVATVDPISVGGLTVTGNGGIPLAEFVTIPGNSSGPFSIEVHASGEAVVQTVEFIFTLNRR